MLVHFIAPVNGLKENINELRLVVKYLQDQGHELARDWLEEAYQGETGEQDEQKVWQEIIQDNLEAITKAEVIIADISYDGTAIGYQIAMAVQQKKPTLLIMREGHSISPFTWNIPSSFLSRVEYNAKNVTQKIEPFLKDNDIATKDMRFNFFINRSIYNYLRWASFKTGKTKAEILRKLIEQEIEHKDY